MIRRDETNVNLSASSPNPADKLLLPLNLGTSAAPEEGMGARACHSSDKDNLLSTQDGQGCMRSACAVNKAQRALPILESAPGTHAPQTSSDVWNKRFTCWFELAAFPGDTTTGALHWRRSVNAILTSGQHPQSTVTTVWELLGANSVSEWTRSKMSPHQPAGAQRSLTFIGSECNNNYHEHLQGDLTPVCKGWVACACSL